MKNPIERVISEQPRFHAWPDGRPANWAVSADVLQFIFEHLQPAMHTLETGAGQTTVVFAVAGTKHIAVTPDRGEASRIATYLDTLDVECRVTFIHESSDVVLPSRTDIPSRLDFVLIDGAHRFPFPILDWHYTEHRIPVGGIVALDDYPMPSVGILHEFLLGEDDWELLKAFQNTAFFRRRRKIPNVWDWADQKINKPYLDKFTKCAPAESHYGLLKRWLGRTPDKR